MFEGIKTIIKTRKLYNHLKTTLEKEKGFCVWPVRNQNIPMIGVTLPDVNTKQEGNIVFKKLEDIVNKTAELCNVKANVDGPYFSAGGVYACYLSVTLKTNPYAYN
jgi:hypothetical protein